MYEERRCFCAVVNTSKTRSKYEERDIRRARRNATTKFRGVSVAGYAYPDHAYLVHFNWGIKKLL